MSFPQLLPQAACFFPPVWHISDLLEKHFLPELLSIKRKLKKKLKNSHLELKMQVSGCKIQYYETSINAVWGSL